MSGEKNELEGFLPEDPEDSMEERQRQMDILIDLMAMLGMVMGPVVWSAESQTWVLAAAGEQPPNPETPAEDDPPPTDGAPPEDNPPPTDGAPADDDPPPTDGAPPGDDPPPTTLPADEDGEKNEEEGK